MFRFSVFFGSLIIALALFAAPIFANTLLGVDYKRLNDQAGQITLTFSELPPRVNQVSEATQTSLTFLNTSLAPEQLVLIDVSQFATFVDALETFQESGSAKLVISHQKAATINQNQNGNQLLIDVVAKPDQALTAHQIGRDHV